VVERPLSAALPSSAADLTFRRPTESDHPAIVGVVDEWWGDGRRLHDLLPRLWFQHFTGTSWIAETGSGRLAGFLVGFISPDDPATAYVHMVAADPNMRRQGIGRALYRAFIDDVAARGVRAVRAITWPGNRRSVEFHRALGFAVDDGPGTQRLYGTPAHADYDHPGEDRVVLMLDVAAGTMGPRAV
jgi:ribosomal protein S18 acetylase RimI-like enzyme